MNLQVDTTLVPTKEGKGCPTAEQALICIAISSLQFSFNLYRVIK